MEVMREENIYLKARECEFEKNKIEYLGLIILPENIEIDPVKVEGVSKWPIPSNVKKVQSFVGFCNFYRRFISNFADIARALHDLTRKDTSWSWTSKEQQ